MDEKEWLSSADVVAMLKFVEDKVTDRKFRLFACACCRRVWDLIVDRRSRDAIEFAERFADGECSRADVEPCVEAACDASQAVASDRKVDGLIRAADAAVWCASIYYPYAVDYAAINSEEAFNAVKDGTMLRQDDQRHAQANLLRDIVRNPFQPSTKLPLSVLKDLKAVNLARGIYDGRRFEDMRLLAEALVNVGWDDKEVLAHCHNGLPHVRGCWVVDEILGLADRPICWR